MSRLGRRRMMGDGTYMSAVRLGKTTETYLSLLWIWPCAVLKADTFFNWEKPRFWNRKQQTDQRIEKRLNFNRKGYISLLRNPSFSALENKIPFPLANSFDSLSSEYSYKSLPRSFCIASVRTNAV
jgi:hypothetical protein